MNRQCTQIRDRLAVDGPGAAKGDEEAIQHIAECDGCYEFLEALTKVEEELATLPQIDVPPEVLDALDAAIASELQPASEPAADDPPPPQPNAQPQKVTVPIIRATERPRLRWRPALGAAAAVFVAVVSVGTLTLFSGGRSAQMKSAEPAYYDGVPAAPVTLVKPKPEEPMNAAVPGRGARRGAGGAPDGDPSTTARDAEKERAKGQLEIADMPAAQPSKRESNLLPSSGSDLNNELGGLSGVGIGGLRGAGAGSGVTTGKAGAVNGRLDMLAARPVESPKPKPASPPEPVPASKVPAQTAPGRHSIRFGSTAGAVAEDKVANVFRDATVATPSSEMIAIEGDAVAEEEEADVDRDGVLDVEDESSRGEDQAEGLDRQRSLHRFKKTLASSDRAQRLEEKKDQKRRPAKKGKKKRERRRFNSKQDAAKNAEIDRRLPAEKTIINFESDDVSGDMKEPDGNYIQARRKVARDALHGRRSASSEAPPPPPADGRSSGGYADGKLGGEEVSKLQQGLAGPVGGKGEVADPAALELHRELAETFLEERDEFDRVPFQEAAGYWKNTYVPGDPALRTLESRLTKQLAHLPGGETVAAIDKGSRPYVQPFDAPASAAVSVFVHSDKKAISGPSRVLVQVGLRASDRKGGRRPAMNVALVIDARTELANDTGAQLRALLEAFQKGKDLGDRFSLTTAGKPGGTVVEEDHFKHGPLTVALQQIMSTGSPGPTLDLLSATRAAIARVGGGDDAPLGANTAILMITSPVGGQMWALEQLLHKSAVDGVPVSVIGVGPSIDQDELERLALAGQGSRRLLEDASGAKMLVDKELASVSRVVARALRLRIRLPANMRLIDVLGSERLDRVQAERVRQMEQSIDRRLSKNLGIESDRGEDEDGIQIVIPSFYAGDAHIILLDCVAEEPGPIAEVSLKYKDLVFLRNGVARASAALDHGRAIPGPLERAVLKSFVAHHVSVELSNASKALGRGQSDAALNALTDLAALIAGLQSVIPGWSVDPDLRRDRRMFAAYEAALRGATAGHPILADSLEFASRLKLLPRPDREE